jgi:hypothetical protein
MRFTVPGSRFRVRVLRFTGAALLCAVTAAQAEVTRVEITRRADLSFAGYEKIEGRVYFGVDPANRRNAVIVDLDRAPRNAQGRVEFSADFYAVRPKTGGNGVAIVDVVNRGNRVTRIFNRVAAGTDPDLGDGFLARRGFTVIAIGWEFDLPEGNGLRITVPSAQGVSGIVRTIIEVDKRAPTYELSDDVPAYPAADPNGPESTLTVRDRLSDEPQTIPRSQWRLADEVVTLDGGFEPGRVYEVSYRTDNPPVAGLGLAAVRDIASWARNSPDAVAPARHVYAFGQSQTGRFMREFLYLGFNADERERLVFDGVMAHIAGGARIDINRRGSTPTAGNAFVGTFPFSDRAQRDPVTGATDGLLENDRARQHQPKLVLTNSSVEYWIDTGRAAALTHTTPDGTQDVALGDNVRSYLFSGAPHTPGQFPPGSAGRGQQRQNPLDYSLSLRALLLGLDGWVRQGVEPPASRYPRLSDGTLVRAQDVAFPAIPAGGCCPAVASPRAIAPGRRASNALLPSNGGQGTAQPLLVPQVDADGNDRAGIRLPEVAVPLATYTGWNFRSPEIGGPTRLLGNPGSYVPFVWGRAERAARRDPRLSIEERYQSRDDYLAKVRQVGDALVRDRYMLAEDVAIAVKRASDHWDLLAPATPTSASAR